MADKVDTLESRQDAQLERTNSLEARLVAVEEELRELRSRSPSVTSAAGSLSPRGSGSGRHDDWQLVMGGWRECRRDDIEEEVRGWFERADCLPLLKNVYCGSVRTNTCRVELLYVQSHLGERRKLQGKVVEALRAVARPPKAENQPPEPLWVKRNRSPEERARIRAIVSLKDLIAKYLRPQDFEFDWRGRFWARGVSVLAHCDNIKPGDGALLLLDARGSETGWWVPGPLLARTLGVSENTLHDHFGVQPSQ